MLKPPPAGAVSVSQTTARPRLALQPLRFTQTSLLWHGLALVPTLQLATIFNPPELLFTHAKVSARAADAAIVIKPSAKAPAIVVISVLICCPSLSRAAA